MISKPAVRGCGFGALQGREKKVRLEEKMKNTPRYESEVRKDFG